MGPQERKAAIAAYKERKAVAGIYCVRCVATGARWVGAAPDLATIRNRLWFTLRQGCCHHRSLQAAWHRHGADDFHFEEIERMKEEPSDYLRSRILKARLEQWRAALPAEAI